MLITQRGVESPRQLCPQCKTRHKRAVSISHTREVVAVVLVVDAGPISSCAG